MTDFVTTGRGDRVAYDRHGPAGGGPALVFVAGAGPSRETDPVTTATARLVADAGVTALVLDRLGRGESVGLSPTPGSVLDLDRELEAVRRRRPPRGRRSTRTR